MKKLLTLFGSLLIVLVISMCSSPTDSEEPTQEFTPYTVGNWTMTSPDQAEYSGTDNNSSKILAKTDSVIATSPDQINMTLAEDSVYLPESETVMFTYTDSLNTEGIEFDNITNSILTESKYPSINQNSTLLTDTYIELEGYISYPCHWGEEDVKDIEFKYGTKNDSLHTVVMLKAEGFIEVIEDIRDC